MNQIVPAPPPRPPLPAGGLEAGVEIGDFRIERRLGAGGMGVVYQARQISLNRPVALKVLGQALSRPTDVSRFQREAQAAARLKHPAIAQVYFIGQDRHVCFLAMELIEGASLRKVLDRLGMTATAQSSLDSVVREDLDTEGEAVAVRFDQPTEATSAPQPPESMNHQSAEVNPYLSPQARELRTTAAYVRRVVEVIRDAAQALAHAHEQGVVHRDIKPDNLLLDRKGTIHLIDFGVARFFEDQAVTYTGQLVGTPLYMSPEQVTGRGAIDARTDIYSLGLVLYELLTLKPPIEATNRENLLRTIVTKPLPPVSWRNAAVQGDLERVVHKATQKDPDQRYASAADLAADLDRFLASQPVAAAPYRFRLDEREITAARPSEVVLAAFVFFVIGFFLFTTVLSMGVMMGLVTIDTFGGMILAIQAVVALAVLGIGVGLGWGVLSAHAWARWIGVAVSGLVCLACVLGIIGMIASALAVTAQDFATLDEAFQSESADGQRAPFRARNFLLGIFAMYAVPAVIGLVLHGTALWALLSRRTAAWFRLASEIRAEHRHVRRELSV
jgi:serine/threonine protein kinase